MAIHQRAGALELFARQVRPIFQDAFDPFLVDRVGPFGAKKVRQGQVHEKIAQRGRVKDTGIVNRGEIRHDQ